MLTSRGFSYTPEDKHTLSFSELEGSADYICSHFNIDITPQQVADEVFAYADECYRTRVALMPGVVELLEKLKGLGITCCLATGTPAERVDALLGRLGVRHYFSHCVTSYDVGKPKHFPDIYLEAIRLAGAAPARSVVFEDTGYSMKAVKDANLFLVGIRQPTTNFGPEYTDLCDLLLDSPGQLPEDFWN